MQRVWRASLLLAVLALGACGAFSSAASTTSTADTSTSSTSAPRPTATTQTTTAAPAPTAGPSSTATAAASDADGVRPAGLSSCPSGRAPRLPCWVSADGSRYRVATFELDPANEPDAATTTLVLIATERECASGRGPEGRDVRVGTAEGPDVIEVVIVIEQPPDRYLACPANPPFTVEVPLSAALGPRRIIDAAYPPGTERPWPIPPPEAVLSLAIAGDPSAPGTAHVIGWTGAAPGALVFIGPEPGVVLQGLQTMPAGFEGEIFGFITPCHGEGPRGGCPEECEGAACEELVRLSSECRMASSPVDGRDTEMVLRFDRTGCTIEVFVASE